MGMQSLMLKAGALIMCTFFRWSQGSSKLVHYDVKKKKTFVMVVVTNWYICRIEQSFTYPTSWSTTHFPDNVDPGKDRKKEWEKEEKGEGFLSFVLMGNHKLLHHAQD